MTEKGIYVYGLVPADALAEPPRVTGVDGTHALECVREGDICALISRVELEQFEEGILREHLADMSWVEQTARRHQQVLDAVLEQCTPLPMRLCTVYSDLDGLRQMLESQQHDLSAALSELRDKLEWGVQIFASARHADHGEEQAAGSGTDYLRRRLAAREAGEQARLDLDATCEHVHAELCESALACRLGAPQRPEISARRQPMLLNAFYLVPNDRRAQFRSRFEQLRDELDGQQIELHLTGPWPPYNFVTAAVGGAS